MRALLSVGVRVSAIRLVSLHPSHNSNVETRTGRLDPRVIRLIRFSDVGEQLPERSALYPTGIGGASRTSVGRPQRGRLVYRLRPLERRVLHFLQCGSSRQNGARLSEPVGWARTRV